MPGVFQFSPDELLREATKAHALGVPAVLLFGIPDNKDAKASSAFAKNGIVQQTVRLLKKELPSLLVITDVCLCEYMSHGHCGIVLDGKILNDPTLKILAHAALSHAEAGADIVAPSDMMDGRVRAIRAALDSAGFIDTAISLTPRSLRRRFTDRSAKPPSPRRNSATGAVIKWTRRMRTRHCGKWLWTFRKGADIVMVKPALAYLDLIHRVKTEFGYPTAAYACERRIFDD